MDGVYVHWSWFDRPSSEKIINKYACQEEIYASLGLGKCKFQILVMVLSVILICVCLPLHVPYHISSSWRWGTRMPTVFGLLIFPWRKSSTVGLQQSSAPLSSAGSTGKGSTGGSWRAFITGSSSTRCDFHVDTQNLFYREPVVLRYSASIVFFIHTLTIRSCVFLLAIEYHVLTQVLV